MRYGRNGALVLSLSCAGLIGLLASTATARDEDFVQVSVVEDTPDTTLIEFHIADPVRGTVRIDGEAWSTMSLGGESIARGVGEPALPDVRRSVMIGSDDAVEANFVRGSYYDIHGIKIAPDKGRISRSIDPATVSYTFGKVYNSAGFWPASIAEVAEPH
ncbi:MAG TPA: hypothetical protein DEO92_02130, partial [Phycisphaerales bacterium]|nr:hypothetical protein [Phycisphaerales bacterium]